MRKISPDFIARKRARRGAFSLAEVLTVVLMSSVLVTAMVAGLRAMSIGASQQVTDSGLGLDARKGVDEMLGQMRYASGVVAAYTSGSSGFTTGNSTIVMTAVGYDPAAPNIVLPAVTDYMIFQYDASTKQIRETVIPGAGSKRVARSRYLLAQNVDSIQFTYRARKEFTQPLSTSTLLLDANAIAAPRVSINGEPSYGAWSSASPKTVIVVGTAGADVQVQYPVSSSDSSALPFIQQVDVAVSLAANDAKNNTRRLSMFGSACLRNHRDSN